MTKSISRSNIQIGSRNVAKFDEMGERDKGPKTKYKFEAFREESKANMMHLKDTHRMKMIKLIMKYSEKGTPRAFKIVG